MQRNLLERGMREAIRLAEQAGSSGNYPIGAVVIGESGIISQVSSDLIERTDPSAHPEMMAIRDAATKLGSRYITNAYLISTLEPCPMCTAAAIWAKMSGIAYAATQEDAKQVSEWLKGTIFTFRQIDIHCRDVIAAGTPRLELFPELFREEVMTILRKFAETQLADQVPK